MNRRNFRKGLSETDREQVQTILYHATLTELTALSKVCTGLVNEDWLDDKEQK